MKISPCSKHYINLHFLYDLLHILASQKNFVSFLLQFVQGSAHICHRLHGLMVKQTASEGTTRHRLYTDDCGRALLPNVMVIPSRSCSLQMVDHTLIIDMSLADVYLDSLYFKGHTCSRVMSMSSPVYPVIIGNVECCQTQMGGLKTSPEFKQGPVGATRTKITMITWVVICLLRI